MEVVVEMGAQQASVTEIASRLVQMAYSSSRNPGEESPFAQAAAAHGASVPVGGGGGGSWGTPLKINMEHNCMEVWKMIFPFFSWVICRFQPLIFQGV